MSSKQKKSPIKQKILQYIDYMGISKYEFYKESGITRGVLDHPTGISEDNIAKFLAYDNRVNASWLFLNEGQMLKKQEGEVNKSPPEGDKEMTSDKQVLKWQLAFKEEIKQELKEEIRAEREEDIKAAMRRQMKTVSAVIELATSPPLEEMKEEEEKARKN